MSASHNNTHETTTHTDTYDFATQVPAEVLLTYAQSLDGKIALLPKRPLRLSSDESMRETHVLRSQHDAIGVGVGTILADDPSLTTRLVPGPSPRPVVFDSHARTPSGSKIFTARGTQLSERDYPIILYGLARTEEENSAVAARLEALTSSVRVVTLGCAMREGKLDLLDCAKRLRWKFGVRTLMIEGGASLITSALLAGPQLVKEVAITISPQFIGMTGVPVIAEEGKQTSGREREEGVLTAATTKRAREDPGAVPFTPLARLQIRQCTILGGDVFLKGVLT